MHKQLLAAAAITYCYQFWLLFNMLGFLFHLTVDRNLLSTVAWP